ncbi:MAG: PilT/PilU family type 4a pilus ATPase [Myxococcales bacterium]|nr:PilT/PilU family type 4a pilus ATPase [Myxococcales bacterium]
MARIDGILNIVIVQNATEIRLDTGKPPKLLRSGAPLVFHMPPLDEETLIELLGPLWTSERFTLLESGESVEFQYDPPGLGVFEATLRKRAEKEDIAAGIDCVFRRAGRSGAQRRLSALDQSSWNDEPAPEAPRSVPQVSYHHEVATRATTAPFSPGLPNDSEESVRPPVQITDLVTPRFDGDIVRILAHAASLGASDLHVAEGETPVLRIDGKLRSLQDEAPSVMADLLAGCFVPSVTSLLQSGRSADFSLDLDPIGRLRCNIYRADSGFAAAIRLLKRFPPRLQDLGLPPQLAELVEFPHGLVIVAGPTGAGKSTTLAAMAQHAQRRAAQVLITIEDPVEYILKPHLPGGIVRQREVGRHVRDFSTGLRDALREDPDLLLVGEMRDTDTISLALTAAETGHLVLTSLHCRTAASAIERIVDACPPQRQQQIRVQLADSLRAVVCQHLLPRKGGKGRIAAVEILRVNTNVASMVREGKTAQIQSAIQAGGHDGMIPLEKHLMELVRAGYVDVESARATVSDPNTLHQYLGVR